MSKYVALFLLPLAIAWGQLTPNSVTVTASRNTNVQPDEVAFNVSVETTLEATRDEVIAALQGSGIGAANFSGVYTSSRYTVSPIATPMQMLSWSFNLSTPISNIKSTLGLLSTVQKNIAGKKNIQGMSFGVQGTRVSAQAQRAQVCSLSELMSDARAQAARIASAAGMSVGAVLAASSSTAASDPDPTVLFGSPAYYPTCSITVKFALGAF